MASRGSVYSSVAARTRAHRVRRDRPEREHQAGDGLGRVRIGQRPVAVAEVVRQVPAIVVGGDEEPRGARERQFDVHA